MIKKCKVLERNQINMVVLYDNIKVQMPTDETKNSEIYIDKIDGHFILGSEPEISSKDKKASVKPIDNKTVCKDDKSNK